MIEVVPAGPEGAGTQIRLRPPRALTAHQFKALFVGLAGVMWGVAGLGWLAGNAFAPVFALLHTALVAAALRWLWRAGERDEVIVIGPEQVEVRGSASSAPAFHAHPYWVRLGAGRSGEQVVLSSRGKQVEVGAFLGAGERRELAARLQELLAAAGGRNR
ncbi:hypothetical protein CSC70_01130 [Pseudoxanthomonas kalamensis DSM 18571]|uniref:DUF2244 domain-containing protein n=1 Tax=Pseudoxanthomonas kalamensis TaxID=289483 RepID=UPI001390C34A|nr:DUF2244 domain-containing protein [Pseudoxanthomonas kalamensis]KAF1712166.1 hypothetical protein CSC70_01130 [Pseudoxanthomonas kalamensis DSM 18571]